MRKNKIHILVHAASFLIVSACSFAFTLRFIFPVGDVAQRPLLIRPIESMLDDFQSCLDRRKKGKSTDIDDFCKYITDQLLMRAGNKKSEAFRSYYSSYFDVIDIHVAGSRYLLYVKKKCAEADIAFDVFTVNFFPQDRKSLRVAEKQGGFKSIDFRFGDAGYRSDLGCVALKKLPDELPDRIDTGYYESSRGYIWHVRVDY